MRRSLLFVNTFEPVVPLYRDVFPALKDIGCQPVAMMSAIQYRPSDVDGLTAGKTIRLWCPGIGRKHKRIPSVLYWLFAPMIILLMPKKDIVFLTQPPLFYIVGALIARARKINYIIHIMDFYPDLLFKSRASGNGLFSRFIQRMARLALLNADRVVVLGRCMRDLTIEKGISPDRIVVVENWPHRSISENRYDGFSFRRKYALSGKFIIMYSGNMGKFHSFDSILEVARRMLPLADVAFVFIGRGVRRREIEKAAEQCDNILVLDHQRAEDFGEILAAGDLHFVSLREGYEGLMVPSKFYGILAAGKPVLYEGSSSGEIARVINEESCGSVLTEGDVSGLEQAIHEYISNQSKLESEGAKSRRVYERRFDRAILIKKYVNAVSCYREA